MSLQTSPAEPVPANVPAEVDVLIVGAGISGVAAAYHILDKIPDTSFTILDAEDNFGGTWWTHRFPGIRSDSDLYTFGYSFKPWVGPPIATAEAILDYMGDVIDEHDLAQYIHYRHRVLSADWSEGDQRWTIRAERTTETGETAPVEVTAKFLFMCQGYYRQREGHMPEWEGADSFNGEIIHTEEWPEDTDYAGKRVVVIGSGATAATIVPVMAGHGAASTSTAGHGAASTSTAGHGAASTSTAGHGAASTSTAGHGAASTSTGESEKGAAAHVTMIQRSPTYFRPGRNAIELVDELRQLQVDEEWIHEITRRKIIHEGKAFTELCFSHPEEVKKELIGAVRELIPQVDIDTHFTPSYDPWRQRLAFVPEADLFEAVNAGKVSVVTGHIERFEPEGIRMTDGTLVEADLVAAATGFNMNIMGDIDFSIDGAPVDFHDTITYRGMMFTGIPNMAWVFGYFRASWTLRSELVSEFVCRLLDHMEANGHGRVEPVLRPGQQGLPASGWMDKADFNPAYLQRAEPLLPKRLDDPEWQHTQDYWWEKDQFPAIDLDDEIFAYRPAS